MNFFNLDGPFAKYATLVADIVIVSVLWFACSLPVITIGSATTAGYYVLTRRLSNNERYIVRDFFQSFKNNFKTSTLVFLTLTVLFAILLFNLVNIDAFGSFAFIAFPLHIIFSAELLFVSIFVFPLCSRFDMGYKTLIKSAFQLANKHLLTTLVLSAMFILTLILCWFLPVIVLFAFGLYCYLSSILFMRLFKRYRPEIDKQDQE